jgi:hypothetical protein
LEKWLMLMRIFGWANEADYCSQPYPPSPTQHDPHGPDDPFRTINYLQFLTSVDTVSMITSNLLWNPLRAPLVGRGIRCALWQQRVWKIPDLWTARRIWFMSSFSYSKHRKRKSRDQLVVIVDIWSNCA